MPHLRRNALPKHAVICVNVREVLHTRQNAKGVGMKRIHLARRRRTIGLSQEALAEQLGVDRSTVMRWESGERTPQPWQRPNLVMALKVSMEELDVLLSSGDHSPPSQTLAAFASLPTQADKLADDFAVMQSLRLADRQAGGGHLYATVTGYLQHTIAPRLFGTQAPGHHDRLFAAAAALTDMAGWMAHDAGDDNAAERHFRRALDLATAAGDVQLGGHILASLSHLSYVRKQPAQAVLFARRGREHLGTQQPTCVVMAKLFAMEARGHAVMGNRQECAEHLRLAEDALPDKPDDSRSPWVSDFDFAAFAADAARCFYQLGHLDSAKRWAGQVIVLRTPDRPRSRAYAQLLLGSVLVKQGKIEEAAAAGHEALESTRTVSSMPVLRQLSELGHALEGHRGNRDVSMFLGLLEQELAGRRRDRGVSSS